MTHRPPLECLILPNLAALQVFLESEGEPTALADAFAHPTTLARLEHGDEYEGRINDLVDMFIVWSTTPQGSEFWIELHNRGRTAVSAIEKTKRFKELQTRLSAYAPT